MVKLFRMYSNLCDQTPPTSQTDRRTDRETDNMRSQYHTLHYSASRGKTPDFPLPTLFDALARGTQFLNETYPAKTRGMWLPYGENFTIPTSTIFLWYTRLTDRRTDGRWHNSALSILICCRALKKTSRNTIINTLQHRQTGSKLIIMQHRTFTVSQM